MKITEQMFDLDKAMTPFMAGLTTYTFDTIKAITPTNTKQPPLEDWRLMAISSTGAEGTAGLFQGKQLGQEKLDARSKRRTNPKLLKIFLF